MPSRDPAMTAEDFRAWLKTMGLTAYAAARLLGVSRSQCHRYSTGATPIPATVARLCDLLSRERCNMEHRRGER